MTEYAELVKWLSTAPGWGVREMREQAADAIERLEARVAELERRITNAYMTLPPDGEAMAWVDLNIESHARRVADEFAIVKEQRRAAEARISALEAENARLRERNEVVEKINGQLVDELEEVRDALCDLLALDDSTASKNDDQLGRIAASTAADAPWCCAILNARAELAALTPEGDHA